jgi:hypothetical protein
VVVAAKKKVAGAAALSAVALATLMGAQPAVADVVCLPTHCEEVPGNSGHDVFWKWPAPGGSIDVFRKDAPAGIQDDTIFVGRVLDVFQKYSGIVGPD